MQNRKKSNVNQQKRQTGKSLDILIKKYVKACFVVDRGIEPLCQD